MVEAITTAIAENLLDIILAVISVVVSYYVIPMLKNELVPWLKEKRLYDMVRTFVQAAEKLAESGAIEKTDKKQAVLNLLEEQGVEITPVIDAAIESAVKELDFVFDTAKDSILNGENEIEKENK